MALHPSDQNRGRSDRGPFPREGANSNRGAYQNLKSYRGGGAKPSRGAKQRKSGI